MLLELDLKPDFFPTEPISGHHLIYITVVFVVVVVENGRMWSYAVMYVYLAILIQ